MYFEGITCPKSFSIIVEFNPTQNKEKVFEKLSI